MLFRFLSSIKHKKNSNKKKNLDGNVTCKVFVRSVHRENRCAHEMLLICICCVHRFIIHTSYCSLSENCSVQGVCWSDKSHEIHFTVSSEQSETNLGENKFHVRPQ